MILPRATVLGLVLTAALLGSGVAIAAPPALAEASTPARVAHRLPPLLNPLPAPEQDEFYRPPSDVTGYQPGQIIRSRPARALLDPRTRVIPSRAWQILYRSTTATGDPNAVSGTVIVPELPWTGAGPRPVVAYAIGTHGFADRCAPSYQLATGTDLELALIYQAVARRWAVVVTDYEGLGTPGDHTYFVQLSEGHAVLDSVRAAMNLLPANVSQDAPVGLWGYSQGGGAAGMAAELAGNYAPELRAVGVAEGGVVADVRAVLRRVARLPAMNGVLPGVVAASRTAASGHADPDLSVRH